MQDQVGIVRTEEDIQRALEGIQKLRDRAQRVSVNGNREYNPGWHTALDLHSLLTVAEAIARSAITRQESRGAHFREDHPEKDEAEGNLITVIKKHADGSMVLTREPKREMPAELQEIIEEMK